MCCPLFQGRVANLPFKSEYLGRIMNNSAKHLQFLRSTPRDCVLSTIFGTLDPLHLRQNLEIIEHPYLTMDEWRKVLPLPEKWWMICAYFVLQIKRKNEIISQPGSSMYPWLWIIFFLVPFSPLSHHNAQNPREPDMTQAQALNNNPKSTLHSPGQIINKTAPPAHQECPLPGWFIGRKDVVTISGEIVLWVVDSRSGNIGCWFVESLRAGRVEYFWFWARVVAEMVLADWAHCFFVLMGTGTRHYLLSGFRKHWIKICIHSELTRGLSDHLGLSLYLNSS